MLSCQTQKLWSTVVQCCCPPPASCGCSRAQLCVMHVPPCLIRAMHAGADVSLAQPDPGPPRTASLVRAAPPPASSAGSGCCAPSGPSCQAQAGCGHPVCQAQPSGSCMPHSSCLAVTWQAGHVRDGQCPAGCGQGQKRAPDPSSEEPGAKYGRYSEPAAWCGSALAHSHACQDALCLGCEAGWSAPHWPCDPPLLLFSVFPTSMQQHTSHSVCLLWTAPCAVHIRTVLFTYEKHHKLTCWEG